MIVSILCSNLTLVNLPTLKKIVSRSKATPGFDVMDYGQETYEFGSSTQDARHFDKYVLKVLQEDAETLSELFNSEEK